MTVDIDSGTGLFDRLGKLGHVLNVLNEFVGGSAAADLPTELGDALAKYDGASNDVRSAVASLLSGLEDHQNLAVTFRDLLKSAAQSTLVEMVDADKPLTQRTVTAALDELIRQMNENSETVDASEPSIASLAYGPRYGSITGATQANPVVITSNSHGLSNGDIVSIASVVGMTEINDRQFVVSGATTNTFQLLGEDGTGHTAYTSGGIWRSSVGNGVVIASIKDGQGRNLENALAEDIVAKVSSNTTAGAETGTLKGEDARGGDKVSHLWPAGSGASTSFTVLSPSTKGFLTNGTFENFTANAPNNWDIDTGVAGTDILEETSTVYRGSGALEFDGDGSTLTGISQDLSSKSLVSRTPYPVHVRVKVDVAPAAGVLVVDLYDGSSVISDDQGDANSLSIDLTTIGTTYVAQTAVFRLPEPVPGTVKIRLRLSTALSNTSSVFIDDLLFGPAMTQVYAAGPYVALVRGDTNFAVDDAFVITVTNAREGEFQELFDKLFQLPTKLLPSATGGSETIDDSLIG